MALKKNKTEILDKIITNEELGYYHWSWLDDDDWDYHDGYCDCYMCMPVDYDYLPDELQPKPIEHISKRGIRLTISSYQTGRLIDMTSIYSKEMLRQKRINHILGIELIEHSRPTFADILNIKK